MAHIEGWKKGYWYMWKWHVTNHNLSHRIVVENCVIDVVDIK